MPAKHNGVPDMKMDWQKIDWSALAGSKVVISNIVTIISTLVAVTGHNLPENMQSQLTDLITEGFTLLGTFAAMYSTYHRVVAQPSQATIIVPAKITPTTPSTPTT
jgi:hypothetical protein